MPSDREQLPTPPSRWARGDIGRVIGSWIMGELATALAAAGIRGSKINAGNLVGVLPLGVAKIAVLVDAVLVGTRSKLNFINNFEATDNEPDDSVDVDLSDTGVVAGTYGDATHTVELDIDAKGRVTGAADVAISTGATANQRRLSLVFQFGDGTNAIVAASEREQWVEANFDGAIEGWSLLADVSGSIVVDVWKDTYTNYPPVVGDSITAAAKPTLTAQTKNTDVTLTGWTTAIVRGNTIKVHVDSASTVKAVTLTLFILKT